MTHKKHGIPRRFSVGENDYAVKFFRKPRINNQNQPIMGFWDSRGTIEIFQGQSSIFIRQVFLHEMLHSLFHHAGRPDLCNDEILVDTLAWLMMGAVETMEFSDGIGEGMESQQLEGLRRLRKKVP